jgi:hypothetical protein
MSRLVELRDPVRTVTLHIKDFQFVGVTMSATLPGEATVVASMVGAPIDPDLVEAAETASDALALIAVNTSNLCCAQRSSIYAAGRAPPLASTTLVSVRRAVLPASAFTGGAASAGDVSLPTSLSSLPSVLIAHIACTTGSLAHRELARTCHALRDAIGSGAVAWPVWDSTGTAQSCTCVNVDAATQTLTRNGRYGHGLVALAQPLRGGRRGASALLEMTVASLDAVGGIQVGIAAAAEPPRAGSLSAAAPSTGVDMQLWFDGCGRLTVGSSIARAGQPPPTLYGDRIRQGDRIALLYDAETASVAMLRRRSAVGSGGTDATDDAPLDLLGPMIALRRPSSPVEGGPLKHGYVFCARFDQCAGLALRIERSRQAPLELASLLARAPAPPRPLSFSSDPALLVRTIGPDALYLGVHLEPHLASVGELRACLAAQLGCAIHEVELRVTDVSGAEVLRVDAQCQLQHTDASLLDEAHEKPLAALGVRIEDNGAHVHRLWAHMPHLLS